MTCVMDFKISEVITIFSPPFLCTSQTSCFFLPLLSSNSPANLDKFFFISALFNKFQCKIEMSTWCPFSMLFPEKAKNVPTYLVGFTGIFSPSSLSTACRLSWFSDTSPPPLLCPQWPHVMVLMAGGRHSGSSLPSHLLPSAPPPLLLRPRTHQAIARSLCPFYQKFRLFFEENVMSHVISFRSRFVVSFRYQWPALPLRGASDKGREGTIP